MTRYILTVIAVLAAVGAAPGEWHRASGPEGRPEVDILVQNSMRTVLEITVPGVEVERREADGRSFNELRLPGDVMATLEVGRPQVPKRSVLLAIPTGAGVTARATVVETRTFPVGDVYPFQPPLKENEQPEAFVFDRDFYSRDEQYPGKDVAVLETGTWRDFDIANIQVYPVQVNPARREVTVATKMRVEVDYSGGRYPDRITDWMVPHYAEYIDNFGRLGVDAGTDYTPGVRYLVFRHSSYSGSTMLNDSLLGWIRQRGYEVRIIDKASFTAAEIKDSIYAEYGNHTPALLRWVLLVGEYADIPTGSYAAVGRSDFWYSDLLPWPAGDNYPEVGIARLSPSSNTDLDNQIRKILKYQRNPATTNNWLTKLTMVANFEDFPNKYSGCVRGVYNMPKPYYNPVTDTIMGQYETGNAVLTNAINAGIGILPYRGHGSEIEWWHWCYPAFPVSWFNTDIAALSNGDMTPVVYNVACLNGDIFYGSCLSETWMSKYPGGAAASLGATQASYTYPNHGICSTLVRATTDTWTITVPGVRDYAGPVFDIGGIMMYMDAYVAKYWPGGVWPENIWMYLFLGDPAMPVWSGGMPLTPVVTHPATVPTGPSTFNVAVTVNGNPVEGALVCAWKLGEFYEAERTDGSGQAALSINALTAGSFQVTVSEGHERHSTAGVAHTPILPYEGTATAANVNDVGATVFLSPPAVVDSGATVTPACSVYNYGSSTETYQVRCRIGGSYNTQQWVNAHAPGTYEYVEFTPWLVTTTGTFAVSCSTELAGDFDENNDRVQDSTTVRSDDVGVLSVTTPNGQYHPGTVITPNATWRNYGTSPASFEAWMILENTAHGRVYAQVRYVLGLGPGANATVSTFPTCSLDVPGIWSVRCSTYMVGDQNPGNDVFDGTFAVRPTWTWGWTEMTSMPATPSGKAAKRGAWLAHTEGAGTFYAAKGYKTRDFYSYSVGSNAWAQLVGIPYRAHPRWSNKAPGRGSKGICDGTGYIYATQGNNSLGWWRYDISADTWEVLEDVPLGTTRKKVKGGTDLVYLVRNDTGYVYLLKGYKTEFYRYNTLSNSWEDLANAPTGSRAKWDKGSWLCVEGPDAPVIYGHKAKYNELYAYYVAVDTWSSDTTLTGMPFIGATGRRKKSKDGACAAWMSGDIYALKGGNTQELWRYRVGLDHWEELDTMPALGSTGRKKRVKYGGDILAHQGALFALKGNKTLEFWRYVEPLVYDVPTPTRGGVAAGTVRGNRLALDVRPNPLTGDFATVRYSLPSPGPVQLTLYDVAGRPVGRHTAVFTGTGSLQIPVRGLSAGVYVLRVDAADCTRTCKLVVE